VTEQELIEAITHLAFYAGWPKDERARVSQAHRAIPPPAASNSPAGCLSALPV